MRRIDDRQDRSGQRCTVEPIADLTTLAVGDIVLCKVGGNEYLHKVED